MPAIPQFINYDTSVTDVVDRRPGAVRAQPHDVRCGRDVERACRRWRSPPATRATTAATTSASSRTRARTCCADGRRRRLAVGRRSAPSTSWPTAPAPGSNEELLVQIGEQPALRHYDVANRTRNRFTGPGRRRAERRVDVQRLGRRRQGRLRRQLLRPAGVDVPRLLVRGRLPAPDGFGAGASYNYERYAGLQRSRSASPGQAPDQENDPLRDWTADSIERVTTSRSTPTPPRIGETPRRASPTTSATPRGTISTPSCPAARCRRRRSSRRCTTSCSSCTSTCGTGCRTSWRDRSRTSTSRSASTTSPSTRRSSTASSSRARWSWVCLSSVYRALGGVRPEVLLVAGRSAFSLGGFHGDDVTTRTDYLLRHSRLPFGWRRRRRPQDAATARRAGGVHRAEVPVCHSIAGKGSKTNPLDGVGTKLSADDIRSGSSTRRR